MKNMACLWGTYEAMRQHAFVPSFRNNLNAFHTVLQHHNYSLAMSYFTEKQVELHEQG